VSGINLSLSEGALISSADGQVMISLKHGHAPTAGYVRKLRAALRRAYPGTTFFFLAPDISTQVLNFGIAAPIDVQVVGAIGNEAETYALSERLAQRIATIPGAVDVHLAQGHIVIDVRDGVTIVEADDAVAALLASRALNAFLATPDGRARRNIGSGFTPAPSASASRA